MTQHLSDDTKNATRDKAARSIMKLSRVVEVAMDDGGGLEV